MPTLVINENSVKEEHVCWFTTGDKENIRSIEVVLATYRRPHALEHAIVQQYEIKIGGYIKRFKKEAAHLIILESAQEVVDKIELLKSLGEE